MKTWHSMPAFAAYAAAAPPALPAVGSAIFVWPSSFAFETAAERPRALNEPVGLPASSLIRRSRKPNARAEAIGAKQRRAAFAERHDVRRILDRHQLVPAPDRARASGDRVAVERAAW